MALHNEYILNKQMEKLIVKLYGTSCKDDIRYYMDAFSAVVAAKKFAGTNGDNPLSALNRAINQLTKK